MKKLLYILLVFMSAAALGLPAVPAQAAKQTWTVIAGGATKDFAVWSNAFHPRSIEVAVGDSVAWKFGGFHTITFLGSQQLPQLMVQEGDKTFANPQVFFPAGGKTYDGTAYANSGAPPEDPAAFAKFAYSLTFTKAGTYEYVCLIHGPAMSGTVVVKEKAAGSPGSLIAAGRKAQSATIKAGQAAWTKFTVDRMGNTVVVPLMGNAKAGFSILRFTPKPLVVKAGTTVTWKMADPFEIHTITFLGGQKVPEFILPEPQKQGPPKLALNPLAAAPTQTKTYDGRGYVNSGILFPVGAPGNLPSGFSLTFTKPGRYEYVCIVHAPEGMKGVIIVK